MMVYFSSANHFGIFKHNSNVYTSNERERVRVHCICVLWVPSSHKFTFPQTCYKVHVMCHVLYNCIMKQTNYIHNITYPPIEQLLSLTYNVLHNSKSFDSFYRDNIYHQHA